jgi:hypothetical protein
VCLVIQKGDTTKVADTGDAGIRLVSLGLVCSTPRGSTHLGTLTFCLPSKFTGGDLVIRQDAAQINVDWANQVLDTETGVGSIGWCFLYSDCEHEVLPVTSGSRVTLAYDVFYYDPPAVQPESPLGDPAKGFLLGDSRANEMLALFSRLFDPKNAKSFFPRGATLGFGLRHAYAGDRGAVKLKGLEDRLKGIDRTLLSVLKQCGLSFKFKAVFDGRSYERERDWQGNRPHEFQVYKKQGEKTQDSEIELAPSSWYFYADLVLAEETEFLKYQCEISNLFETLLDWGCQVRPDVVWIAKPSLYDSLHPYVAYGNEVSSGRAFVEIIQDRSCS